MKVKKILGIVAVLTSVAIAYGFSHRLPKAREITSVEATEAKRQYEEQRSQIGYIPKFNEYMLAKPKVKKNDEPKS